MEDSIDSITNNIFKHVSLSEQENIKQWEKDRDEFKEQLSIELIAIKDKEVRNAVISRLMESTKDEQGKNYINANGSVNIGKIKDSAKSMRVEVEEKIIKQRQIEEQAKDTIKAFVISETEQAKQVERVKKEYEGVMPKGLSDEQKDAVYKKIAEMESKANYYMGLLKRGISAKEALQKAGVAGEDLKIFNDCLEKIKYERRRDELKAEYEEEQKAGINNPNTQKKLEEAEKEFMLSKKKLVIDAAKQMFKNSLKKDSPELKDGNLSLGENLTSQLSQTAEWVRIESEINDDLSNRVELEKKDEGIELYDISNQTKEILIGAIDEGLDNIDDFRAFVEDSLEGITDETLRGKVSQAIEQLTQNRSLGDSGKSFEELLEAGELDESIIDSVLELQSQEIEQEETTIADNVTSIVYIEKGESFVIDETWEKLCQVAQERGESLNGSNLERLLSQYMEGQGLEQIEAPKNPPSTLGEKAGEENELTGNRPVIENPEVIQNVAKISPKVARNLQENGENRGEGNEDKNSIETREYADKDGNNKRAVRITNNENGEITNIQVFKSLIANVRMGQIEAEMKEIGALANSKENAQNKQEPGKEGQEDILE